jgi:hypothetical protein
LVGELVGCAETGRVIERGRVERGEWRWLAAWTVVALIVSSVPYAIGAIASTPERVFGGATFAVEDVYSYFAKMRQGASGAWLYHLPYSSEAHDGALFFLFHLLLGKFSALMGWPLEVAYHVARIVFGALLLVTLYRFIAAFTGSTAIRRIAFLLATFGGGLGWLLMLAGQPNWLGSPPLDLILPEGFTFLVLYALPHIALARTLLLAGLLMLWRSGESGASNVQRINEWGAGANRIRLSVLHPLRWAKRKESWLAGWQAGLCWTAMALIVPFYVLVVYAIVLGGLIATSLRGIDRAEVGRAAIACALAAIVPAYSVLVFSTNPLFAVWGSQNQITSPHPLHYLAAYGAIGGLALLALRRAWRRDRMWRRLIGWLIVIPPLLYAPFGLQRRLIEAWPIPLSILAAVTLVRWVLPPVRRSRFVRWLTRFPRYTPGGMQRWALSAMLLFTFATFALLLVDQSLRAAARQAPLFRDGGEIAALDWLRTQVDPDDAVLAAYDTGNYLPARVAARSFIGHGPETAHLEQKRPLAAQFFNAATDDTWRASFVREWGIDFVFVGPYERALGDADLSGRGYLELEYESGRYRVYRVIGESTSQRVSE